MEDLKRAIHIIRVNLASKLLDVHMISTIFSVIFQLEMFKWSLVLIYLYQRHSPQVTGVDQTMGTFVSKVVGLLNSIICSEPLTVTTFGKFTLGQLPGVRVTNGSLPTNATESPSPSLST